ncbi:GNAT family N-acetyltransferase [Chamaesiphon sp.]|uniref:GNAT family N-acetyltransferase n=1 Tax=Chamaesiphon sp. TaxID=2814140 RepID=UPI003593311E
MHDLNVAAFGRDNEADLVDKLRGVASTFSFVAVRSDRLVGHIFFSPVKIASECPPDLIILGLAPVAVLPNYQRQGIGSVLIRYSLQECTRCGVGAVVVLGSPTYYSRFGFVSAKAKGLSCEYAVPDEAFMVLELASNALVACSGIVKYRSEFGTV